MRANLALADYFLFYKLKSKLKGLCFDDIADIQKNVTVTVKLKSIAEKEYSHALKRLAECVQSCINSNGMYLHNIKKIFWNFFNLLLKASLETF